MRFPWLIGVGLVSVIAWAWSTPDGPALGQVGAPDSLEKTFRDEIRPFLENYCVSCHGGEKPKSDLDLSVYPSVASVAADLKRWDLVVEQLEAGTMPPAKAKKRPAEGQSRAVLGWLRAVRKDVADRHAGDPGPVTARRLSNAEYDYTIRDLTGVDIRPTREFPVDPANEAGFDNSGESLAMSPALAKKYLEAARAVADHLVLKPAGFDFAPHPILADTDRDKYSVNRIIDFYKRQKTDYADYFYAAWQFRNRASWSRPELTLDDLAAHSKLSAKYLAFVWQLLEAEDPESIGPIAALRAMFRGLPAYDRTAPEAARAGCRRMADFVVGLRAQLIPEVKNLPARGISNGSQPLVLWKNRKLAANHRRYAGGIPKLKLEGLALDDPAVKALAVPESLEARERFEASCFEFCSIFPDTFYVSERARVYLDPKGEKGNAGRLLSAGFHSMTGYFRDDGPLYELMLDDRGQKELDRLWREFDFITGAPIRQYTSYLWYERAETGYMRGDPSFDFVRAEDKDATSEASIQKFAEVYLAKARRINAGEPAIQAVADQFAIISESIREVERDRAEAEPSHVAALLGFAERAFRRPLSDSEKPGIVGFYRTLRERDGLGHEDAIRDTVVRILMSPHFCYRVAPAGGGPGVRALSDSELANRLSYFLWSSMPDSELMALARSGELRKPEVLIAQTRRMLRDDRVRGLVAEFGGNWLDFRRFEEHNSVDRDRFKTFDDELRRSMFEEPIRFFLDVVQRDRPILDFLEAKHTFVNPALARHYGMPVASGGPDDWTRVDDATPYGRGGLLPMAVFLTRNSPGLRTSPVKRGYWVVRRLLGEAIPPPPANVPELPDDESKLGDLTLREALARHRADKACAGCHERFDAIGLAFEGFGPVGELRERDLAGHPVDVRANFPGGSEGAGVEGLRTYLKAKRESEFVENLCRKLLAFGLGRTLIPSDDSTVEALQSKLKAENHRFGALVEGVVVSPQFLNKRVEFETAEARP
jgi:hypothetical protein